MKPKKSLKSLKKHIPKIRFRPALFWDTDPKKLDTKKHAFYIIERILDFGRDREVRWMSKRYSKHLLRQVVQNSRVLHAQTTSLWQILLELPKIRNQNYFLKRPGQP